MSNVDPGVVVIETDDALRWFHTPMEHAAQILVTNFLLVPLCLWLYRAFSKQESAKKEDELAPKKPPHSLFLLEKLLVLTLCVAWVLQLYHKSLYSPRRLLGFLYPCHPISALVLYSFYMRSRNYRVASYVWSFTIQCCILSGIAMALPDTSDIAEQYRWWAVPVFWIHHGLLTVVPWVSLLTGAFHVEPQQFNKFWFPFAYALWTLYFFNVQQTTSLFFNTIGRTWGTDTEEICNVNYMIYPPPVAGLSFAQR